MIYLRFAGAAAALVWGLCTAFRPRVPLYYKTGAYREIFARLKDEDAEETP